MKQKVLLYRMLIITLVILNVGCDQISKDVVRKHVASQDYITLLQDKVILTNVENTGAMLGFGADFSPLIKIILLQLLPLLVLVLLLYRVLTKKAMGIWLAVAFAFVIGGGIGNLIDRIAYGSVTDFFQIRLGFFRTGIFNMADVAVTLGILLILALTLFNKKVAF